MKPPPDEILGLITQTEWYLQKLREKLLDLSARPQELDEALGALEDEHAWLSSKLKEWIKKETGRGF